MIQENLPDLHGGKSSRDKQIAVRNPLREKDRNPRIDSGGKHNNSHLYEGPHHQKLKQDQTSAREKLAYILGRAPPVRDNSRHNLDRYISIEHNGESSKESAAKVHSYEHVAEDYPSYRKHDEVSRIRLNNEGIRAQSSKRLPPAKVKARYKEYSLQPKYNAHSRHVIEKELEKQRAAIALDPYKQYPGRPTYREPSAMEARIVRGIRIQGGEPERYQAQRPQVIKRPEYYPKIKDGPYIYHQPDWWG